MYRTRPLQLLALGGYVVGAFALSHSAFASDAKKVASHVKFPVLPPEAKTKHLSGSGVILVHVRPDGTVARAEVARSSGHKILDDAALTAFSQWQFIPG